MSPEDDSAELEATPELLAFLKEEEVRSRHEDLQMRAEVNLLSYKGAYYGDEVDGRSKAVARDVAEVIDHMEISVLRTFVSGDRVVEFEPIEEADEQAADDATEIMQRDFKRRSYRLLHDWFKEGNLSVLGVVKACYEKQKKKTIRVVPELILAELGNVISTEPAGEDPEMGPLVRATILEEKTIFYDRLVPLEEFRVSPDAYTVEEAAYVAHAVRKTVSELIEMGFDPDLIEEANDETMPSTLTSLGQARSSPDYMEWGIDREGALRAMLFMEEYVQFDLDEDGIAERLCVQRVGDTVFKVHAVDYQPFVIYCPFPMPGRIEGEALAEKVTDIQRINTALLRLGLDGLYCNLAPGYLVADGSVNENTYDDLLTVRPNRIVRYSGPQAPVMEVKPDFSQTAFNAIEFMIGQRESRTGVTRLNQGLDADTLNKTATGTALMQAQGQQMEEYLARNFAEAVAQLMGLKLKLYRMYGGPQSLRVDGEYRQVDPSQWPEEMDLVIRVGLGTGSKERRLAQRMNLLEIQREVMLAGLPIVGPEQIYKSVAGVVRDASLGSPSDFVIDPSTLPPQQPQPSPDEMKMRAELQLKQADLQGRQQDSAAQLQLAQDKAVHDANLARAKAATDAQLQRDKAEADAQLQRDKAQADAALRDAELTAAREDAALKLETQREEAALQQQLARDKAAEELRQARENARMEQALMQQRMKTEMLLAREKMLAEIQLAREKQEAEMELAVGKAHVDAHIAGRKMALKESESMNDLPNPDLTEQAGYDIEDQQPGGTLYE